YERRPIQEFRECFDRIRQQKPGCKIVLIIDEFQELVKAIADADNKHKNLDNRVLSAWHGELEEKGLIFVLTGSLRVSKVGNYLGTDAFFRRVDRIPVGFLSADATKEAL